MRFQISKFWSRLQKFAIIFIVQKIRYLNLYFNVNHIYGPEKVDYDSDNLIVLCLVRDGQLYIKSFIEHYFSLGVKHIVFLDNYSIDDTVTIAKKYKNVTVLQTNLSFKKYKVVMRQYLIKRFSKNKWSLYVDIDELFYYPFHDSITLNSFLTYLNKKRYTAVVAHLLDMFSEKSLTHQNNKTDDLLQSLYRYYDVSDISKMRYYFPRNQISNDQITIYFGGIRRILFGTNDGLGDLLTKHPLIFLDRKIKPMYLDEHDVRNANIADFTCVLCHYKFLDDFYERTLRAVHEENYANKSTHYKRYHRVLKRNPNLQIKRETSQKLNSINELIDNEFLIVSEDYMAWVSKYRIN